VVAVAPTRKSFSESTVVRSASKASLDKDAEGEEAGTDEIEEEKKRSFTSEGGWAWVGMCVLGWWVDV
jgi:hypothetical protein